jgi:branched-chain amino acid transport system substrate-binding protein
MKKRTFLTAAALSAAALAAAPALAQDNTFKIGLILPMTGQQATTGRQIEAAVRLYMAQNGDSVAGKKIQLIVKDDTSLPDTTRRLAQELVVNDKVNVLAGFGITPSALATAPIATQSKTPMVVMAAATSSITQASPYIVRSSFTLPQVSVALADWAPKNGIKTVVTLVSDYGPGIDAEKFFKDRLTFNGGQVTDALRVPLRNPDFAPFLQKVRDNKPDALFVFVPSGAGAAVMKQFLERGLDKASRAARWNAAPRTTSVLPWATTSPTSTNRPSALPAGPGSRPVAATISSSVPAPSSNAANTRRRSSSASAPTIAPASSGRAAGSVT